MKRLIETFQLIIKGKKSIANKSDLNGLDIKNFYKKLKATRKSWIFSDRQRKRDDQI